MAYTHGILLPGKLNIKNPIKNSTKRVVKEKYEQIILEKLSNLDENSKLFLYNILKNEIKGKLHNFLHVS